MSRNIAGGAGRGAPALDAGGAGHGAPAADARSGGACVDRDVRCACGSLLARLVAGGVELKCRRCKQTWRIPLTVG